MVQILTSVINNVSFFVHVSLYNTGQTKDGKVNNRLSETTRCFLQVQITIQMYNRVFNIFKRGND